MNLPSSLKVALRQQVNLASYCTMQVGGPAAYFAEPKSEGELIEALEFAREESLEIFILGKGSNVVFSDQGFRGVVISLLHYEHQLVRIDEKTSELTASSGVHLYRLACICRDAGYGGTEFLAGIPGTVGGAVMMNAGYSRHPGQKNEIGDIVRRVTVLDTSGRKKSFDHSELNFSYRHSGLEGHIILSAVLRVWKRPSEAIQREIAANTEYRNEKQDLSHPSSGSIFKNPPHPLPTAGKIIDDLGLKGTRIGGMMISPKHGNYFIKVGPAKSADLIQLIETVQEAVLNATGIYLKPEVRIIKES